MAVGRIKFNSVAALMGFLTRKCRGILLGEKKKKTVAIIIYNKVTPLTRCCKVGFHYNLTLSFSRGLWRVWENSLSSA